MTQGSLHVTVLCPPARRGEDVNYIPYCNGVLMKQ